MNSFLISQPLVDLIEFARKENQNQLFPECTQLHDLYDEPVEHFYILLLDRNHQVLKIHKISSGGTNATRADPKLIFKKALDHLASGIILVHNHPSRNLKPSEQDRTLTRRLSEAGKYLEISVLDHVWIFRTKLTPQSIDLNIVKK